MTGSMCRRILAALSAAVVSMVAPLAGAREFRAADTQTYDYPTVQALLHMDRLVQERTKGRHSIKVFHSRQLGEEKETIEQTRVGAIDLNRSSAAPFGSFVPEAAVLSLPFLFRSIDHMHRVIDGPVGSEILGGFEQYGFVGLAFYDSGARSIYNSVRPIRTPGDISGLRIRVQQTDIMVAAMKALGAEPVPLPYGQVVTGLATGIVDGAENNWPSYMSTDHFKHARFYSATEHTIVPEVLVMSAKAWATLDEVDRNIFREAARESSLFMRAEWRAWEERAKRQAAEAGVSVTDPIDKKPFEAALRAVYDEFVTDRRLKSLVERIRQVE